MNTESVHVETKANKTNDTIPDDINEIFHLDNKRFIVETITENK